MNINFIADLRSLTSVPGLTEDRIFFVTCHSTINDQGGGTFMWVPVSLATPLYNDDDGIVIRTSDFLNPLYNQGYFLRQFSGPINVRWFGAKGDGITDDTVAVHNARKSKHFANNGTLYFPVGKYKGAFEFEYFNTDKNEINIIGDGQGTILVPNGQIRPDGNNKPVLLLGYRQPHWKFARVSNLKIDGSFNGDNYFAWGVYFENPSNPSNNIVSGRWVFERVLFVNCDKAVFKPSGNIGNHFIDCTWGNNVYGIYAIGHPDDMHCGCDRYSGGHFSGSLEAAIAYGDNVGLGGQIIIDGTVIENNIGYGITVFFSKGARLMWNAICLRNVWFETNNSTGTKGARDIYFKGVHSARIDDSFISTMKLEDSTVNLFNCRQDGYFIEGHDYDNILVDEKSSIVAYEHRYKGYPGDKIYVNSISYDNSPELYNGDSSPRTRTSVWGPLRLIETSKSYIVVTEQFDSVRKPFDILSGGGIMNTIVTQMHVLGIGSGRLHLSANQIVRSQDVIGIIENRSPRYCVWSIHTYLQTNIPEEKIIGYIISEDENVQLGNVYFKYDQWVCSYGMKLIDKTEAPLKMRLDFHAFNEATFCITDYQIVMFDDLHSANSFVNSREFAKFPLPEEG